MTSKIKILNIDKVSPKNNIIVPFKYAWPFPQKPSWFYRLQSNLACFLAFGFAKFVVCGLNRLQISPEHKRLILKSVEDKTRPLLTVSNHRCVVDDPLIWASLSFGEFFRNISRFRYVLAAHDICFTSRLLTWACSSGRCVPCVRGEGVFQRGVDHCIQVINNRGWVHVFPEGKVTLKPIRIKWGVARMIADAQIPPMILPIWIKGMRHVWTEKRPYRPRIGETVEVFVGQPIDTSTWLIHQIVGGVEETELERRKRLADLVQNELFGLGKQMEKNKQIAERNETQIN